MSLLGTISSINPFSPLGGVQNLSPLQDASNGIPTGLPSNISVNPSQLQDFSHALQAASDSLPGMLNKVQGLSGATPVGAASDVSAGATAGATGVVHGGNGSSKFVNLLDSAVQEVNGKMNAADVQQGKMMTGESTNLHQTMISMQEANVALSLMVQVRNKLVESYQELMRMQV